MSVLYDFEQWIANLATLAPLAMDVGDARVLVECFNMRAEFFHDTPEACK